MKCFTTTLNTHSVTQVMKSAAPQGLLLFNVTTLKDKLIFSQSTAGREPLLISPESNHSSLTLGGASICSKDSNLPW